MERKICSTIIILLCAWLSLSSCTYNPMSQHNELTGSATGTLIGGGIGAGTMAIFDASPDLVVAGGLGGAALGYYVTSLRFASGGVTHSGGKVYTLGESIAIEIPSDSLFDSNSSEILPEAHPILDSAIAALNHSPCNNILISASTSGFGSEKYEQQLSENRAREVAAYLWANGINGFQDQSIKVRKLTYVGYGSYFPIANSITAKGVRQNSRVQITAYPTRAQLHLDKRYKVFNNIGGQDAPSLAQEKQPYDYSREFPTGETLPEGRNSMQTSAEYLSSERNYMSQPSLRREAFPNNDNTIHGTPPHIDENPHLPSNDLKAEGGFKGEN